jgi:electron transfer flavoprotein beta subunit
LNIVVCIKQVPDTTAEKRLDRNLRLDRATADNILNPFDEYAVEEALRIKEAQGADVIVLSMGPETALDAIRKALAMGADRGALVTDPALVGSDSLATAAVLAAAATKLGADLVICGMEATDSRAGQVPSALAEILGWPQLTWANKLDVAAGRAIIHRQSDAGYDVVESALPAVVSVTKAINEPRYPSLKGIMMSKKKPVDTFGLADLGLSASDVGQPAARTKVTSYITPPPRGKGQLIAPKTASDAAAAIADYLQREKLI